MTLFKPVKQFRVSASVAEQLKQAICLGHFKAGDKLPSERDLAEEFQVSRVAVREALRAMENAGFINTKQGATGGAYVTDLTFQQLANAFADLFLAEKISLPELYKVRLLVEPEVARLAAFKVTAEYAGRIHEAVKAEEITITSLSDDVERKQMFHFILAEMCGNRFLEAIIRSLMGVIRKVVEAVEADPHIMHPAGMHNAIAEAVLAGDSLAAAEAMKIHTIEFGESLMRMEKAFREKKAGPSF